MKLQNLAVIFAIIILPISLILGIYIDNQIETLRLQISYDSKLNNATYDALKAFQLNTVNNSASDLSESKISDIEASVNSFFNSIASNFNMPGYNRDVLKEYVPALVYTMYDGYYIYSEYNNKITSEDYLTPEQANERKATGEDVEASTYQDGEQLSGLKSYVYYSCRYKKNDADFVITYSLDNYITIKGVDYSSGKIIDEAGYLIDNISGDENNIEYRDIQINNEDNLREYLVENDGTIKEYTYKKINGVKNYKVEETGKCFSILNGERMYTNDVFNQERNNSAVKYYSEAKTFRENINKYIDGLKPTDAVGIDEETKKEWRRL